MSNIYNPLISLILPLLFLTSCGVKSTNTNDNITSLSQNATNNNSNEKQRYFLGNIDGSNFNYAANIYPICQTYVDALNKYGVIEDFFKAPIHPNSPEFGYPKWEQWDIYGYKDIYLRIVGSYIDIKNYPQKKVELEKRWNANDTYYKNKHQMYYARADINNDGKLDDMLRIDYDRYDGRPYNYHSRLTTFDGEIEKSFGNASESLNEYSKSYFARDITTYDLFFYKGETYIKNIQYDLPKNKLKILRISKFGFNGYQEPSLLCNVYDDPNMGEVLLDITEEDNIPKKYYGFIYYERVHELDNTTHIYAWANKSVANTDQVCQELLDALNNKTTFSYFSYSARSLFESITQINSSEITYPKWEQLDIYEYKDLFIRLEKGMSVEEYFKKKDELIKWYEMEDSRSEKSKNSDRRLWQMYYARADINNDGKLDDIIRLDVNRYVIRYHPNAWTNHLIVFDGESEKSFIYFYKDLNREINKKSSEMYNFFLYKGKTYIENVSYWADSPDMDRIIRIRVANGSQELETLCIIK